MVSTNSCVWCIGVDAATTFVWHPGCHLLIWPTVDLLQPLSPSRHLVCVRGDRCYLLSSEACSGHMCEHSHTLWAGSYRQNKDGIHIFHPNNGISLSSLYVCVCVCLCVSLALVLFTSKVHLCVSLAHQHLPEGEQNEDSSDDRTIVHSPAALIDEAEV